MMDTNECHSSRGAHSSPSPASLVIRRTRGGPASGPAGCRPHGRRLGRGPGISARLEPFGGLALAMLPERLDCDEPARGPCAPRLRSHRSVRNVSPGTSPHKEHENAQNTYLTARTRPESVTLPEQEPLKPENKTEDIHEQPLPAVPAGAVRRLWAAAVPAAGRLGPQPAGVPAGRRR